MHIHVPSLVPPLSFYLIDVCHFIFSHLEPGPVQNLTASFNEDSSTFISDTRMHTVDIVISWIRPTQPNGEITGYNVTVYRTSNISDSVYSNTTVTETMISPSVMVLPFTDYNVSVSASTSAGEGGATEVTVESPEAGRYFLLLPALPLFVLPFLPPLLPLSALSILYVNPLLLFPST